MKRVRLKMMSASLLIDLTRSTEEELAKCCGCLRMREGIEADHGALTHPLNWRLRGAVLLRGSSY